MLLDLKMGSCHIRLREQARNLCTTILPWGKYWYKRLAMGVSTSLYIFPEKRNEMFHGFDFIRK